MADTILTSQEEEEIRKAVESYAERRVEGGPQDIFCKNWPTVRQVLEFLAGILPEPYRGWIKKVIALGDLAHNSPLCPKPS